MRITLTLFIIVEIHTHRTKEFTCVRLSCTTIDHMWSSDENHITLSIIVEICTHRTKGLNKHYDRVTLARQTADKMRMS